MGGGGAADPARQARRPAARGGPARGGQHPVLPVAYRRAVGAAAPRPGAQEHRPRLLQGLAGRHLAAHGRRLARGRAPCRGPGRDAQRRLHRQPVGQDDRGGRGEGLRRGKRVKGRKRHIVVDTLGLLLAVAVTAANLDDGTHAKRVLSKLERAKYPRLEVLYGDNKYRNRTLDKWLAQTEAPYRVEVSTKGKDEKGFVPIRIRWRVERGIACLNRYRRLSKDYERNTSSSEAWVQVAAIQRMVRRLRPDPDNKQPDFKYLKKHKEAA